MFYLLIYLKDVAMGQIPRSTEPISSI